jgi:hypothetical protein
MRRKCRDELWRRTDRKYPGGSAAATLTTTSSSPRRTAPTTTRHKCERTRNAAFMLSFALSSADYRQFHFLLARPCLTAATQRALAQFRHFNIDWRTRTRVPNIVSPVQAGKVASRRRRRRRCLSAATQR